MWVGFGTVLTALALRIASHREKRGEIVRTRGRIWEGYQHCSSK
jgi:hypothetical protein